MAKILITVITLYRIWKNVYLMCQTKYKEYQKNDWDKRLSKITKINKIELSVLK